MKNFKTLLYVAVLFFLATPFVQAQDEDLNVSIDTAPDVDLSDYNSYFWVTDFSDGEDIWVTMNKVQGQMIKDAVEYEMDILGMEWNPENPDILVNFHIFDKELDRNLYVDAAPYEYMYQDKKAIMEEIEDGTILISLIDKKTGKSVWEGYATMGVEEDESLRAQQASIRQATSAIMDRFNPEGLSETSTLR